MKRKVWLLLAVVPVLLAAYALKRSLIPAAVSGGAAPVDQRAQPGDSPKASRGKDAATVSGSTPQESTMVQPLPGDLDPFAMLDKQYEASRSAEAARFDAAEARIRAGVQPILDASFAEHKRNIDNVDRMNLSADQKMHWNRLYNVQYEKARLDIQRTIQPDLDKLAAKRKEVLGKLESARMEKRTRLQEIQAKAEKGQIDSRTAKRTQFEVLGISLPASALESSQEHPVPTGTETAPPKTGAPTVLAIVATGDDRFCALIGEALVSEGDIVQGYRVRKIGADTVEFEKDGETWVRKAD